jgi:hypothetical protein
MIRTGIYFLLDRKRVVYIGKTEQWPIRIGVHKTIKFDEVKLFECDVNNLTDYENRLIGLFNPRHNISASNKRRIHCRLTREWVRENADFIRASIESSETGSLIAKARKDLNYSPRYNSSDMISTMIRKYESEYRAKFNWEKRKFSKVKV